MTIRVLALACFLSGLSVVALANDTSAELAAGGLEFTRSDAVSMVREDLFISTELIKVDYEYENVTDDDVTTIVAFPMPDITLGDGGEVSIPNWMDENFMGFSVRVNGQTIEPSLQQRAIVSGVDVSRELLKRGVSLANFRLMIDNELAKLDANVLEELEQLGLVYVSRYDAGNGESVWVDPLWTLESVYYWTMTFPAGETVYVTHTYMPAVGASAGLGFSADMPLDDEYVQYYVDKYCVDESFMAGLRNRTEAGRIMWPSWISYILRTGANWYRPIGTFHLTVDKGSEENLVSWCGTGIKKTGPTTFEVTIQDFYPEEDLEIFFIQNVEN